MEDFYFDQITILSGYNFYLSKGIGYHTSPTGRGKLGSQVVFSDHYTEVLMSII